MASKRPAKIELRHKDTGEKVEFGGVFVTQYPGSYSVALTLPTGETDENDYPIRERITDVRTESGRKFRISDFWINMSVFEPLSAKKKRQQPTPDLSAYEDDSNDF